MLADGTLVGTGYRVLCKQGANRYLEEYDAEELATSRVLALKIIKGLPELPESACERLESTVHALRYIEHPRHIPILGVVIHEGSAALLTERHRGERLYFRIDRGDIGGPREVLRIGVQLLEYLQVLHAAGVVHKDVRPGTVLREVMEFGRVEYRLLNTGVSQILDEWSPDAQRAPGMIRRFASPERLRGEPVGPMGDLYGVGATLWACLEERAPFLGCKTEEEIVEAMAGRSRLELDSGGAPEKLIELIHRLTAMDESRRFPSAELALSFIHDELSELYAQLEDEEEEDEDFAGALGEIVVRLLSPSTRKPDEELGKKHGCAVFVAVLVGLLSGGAMYASSLAAAFSPLILAYYRFGAKAMPMFWIVSMILVFLYIIAPGEDT